MKKREKDRHDSGVVTPRRRVTDNPQPLDYPTLKLVREIIDNQQRVISHPKSFIQKLLDPD